MIYSLSTFCCFTLLFYSISCLNQICFNMMNTSGTRTWNIKISKKMETWLFSDMKLYYSKIFCIYIIRKKVFDKSIWFCLLPKKFLLLKASCTSKQCPFQMPTTAQTHNLHDTETQLPFFFSRTQHKKCGILFPWGLEGVDYQGRCLGFLVRAANS